MKQELSGIIVPILTPLDAQENVDEARLRRQVDFVIEGGVNGILLFGSNGEFCRNCGGEFTCLELLSCIGSENEGSVCCGVRKHCNKALAVLGYSELSLHAGKACRCVEKQSRSR